MPDGKKATQLSEISQFANLKPLDETTWHMWVDTEEARGNGAVLKLVEQLREASSQPDPVKVLLTGHSGSGKSTELFRVKQEVEELYHIVIARIGDRYSLSTVDYRQLLFFCASQLIEIGAEQGASVTEKDEAESLVSWFDKTTREGIWSEGDKFATEVGAKLSVFRALFANFSGRIYSGGETRERAVRHIESRLDQLLFNMQIIVRRIEERLDGKKLLLILEDLDKIEDRDQGRKLFFEHRRQLLDIPCSAIFTFPIVLWYEQEAGVLNYPIRYLLPMIPVASCPPLPSDIEEGEQKANVGRETLKQIIFQRIDENADIITSEALDYLIAYSGGVLRDLLYMLREAAIGAKVKQRARVEMRDIQDAAHSLRDEYANRLSPRLYGEVEVSLKEIEGVLGESSDWPKWTLNQTAAFKMLLQSLCILEYNGQRWFDLHPAVREYIDFRAAEQKRREASKSKAQPK